jgi:hypothetical protein
MSDKAKILLDYKVVDNQYIVIFCIVELRINLPIL